MLYPRQRLTAAIIGIVLGLAVVLFIISGAKPSAADPTLPGGLIVSAVPGYNIDVFPAIPAKVIEQPVFASSTSSEIDLKSLRSDPAVVRLVLDEGSAQTVRDLQAAAAVKLVFLARGKKQIFTAAEVSRGKSPAFSLAPGQELTVGLTATATSVLRGELFALTFHPQVNE